MDPDVTPCALFLCTESIILDTSRHIQCTRLASNAIIFNNDKGLRVITGLPSPHSPAYRRAPAALCAAGVLPSIVCWAWHVHQNLCQHKTLSAQPGALGTSVRFGSTV